MTYELETVEILNSLLRRSTRQDDALERYYHDFRTLHGIRPTATEVYEDGYNPRAVRERAGSWMRFVGTMGDLDATQQRMLERHEAFIDALDTTEMVKSYKMLVLLAMLNADRFPGSIPITDLADHVAQIATRTTRAAADLGSALNDRKALIRLLEQNPLAAWAGGKGTAGVSYFSYRDEVFQTTFSVEQGSAPAFQEMVRELAEWRLTEYLDRARTQTAGFSTLKVSQANGRPLLFLPPEPERSDLPEGWTDVIVGGAAYSANFVKVAINVIHKEGHEENELPPILRRWFGPDAGAPGTRHTVALELKDNRWHLAPLGRREGRVAALAQLFERRDSAAVRARVLNRNLECRFCQTTWTHLPSCDLGQVRSRIRVPVQGPFHQPKRVRVAEPESNESTKHGWPGHPSTCRTGIRGSPVRARPEENGARWRGTICLLRRRAVRGVAWRSANYGEMEAFH